MGKRGWGWGEQGRFIFDIMTLKETKYGNGLITTTSWYKGSPWVHLGPAVEVNDTDHLKLRKANYF